MTYVNVDNTHVNSEATYEFGFKTVSNAVDASDKIWIDWPYYYYKAFFFDEYECSLNSTGVTGDISCEWDVYTGK